MAKRVRTAGTIAQLAQSFALDLRARNRSPRTIQSYLEAVAQLDEHLGGATVDAITRESTREFLVAVQERASASTAANRYRSLRQFTKWLVAEGELADDPMAGMSPPKAVDQPPDVLTSEQLRSLLKTCDGSLAGRRDEAILRVFIDTGARLAEVAGLRATDVDLVAGTARVLGKGGFERVVPLGAKTVRALDRYIRAAVPTDHLWVGKRGRFGGSGISQMVRDRGLAAGIPGLHPHQFRHSAADRWLRAGGSETGLMNVAGWRSREMVGRYARATAAARALEEHRRLALDSDL